LFLVLAKYLQRKKHEFQLCIGPTNSVLVSLQTSSGIPLLDSENVAVLLIIFTSALLSGKSPGKNPQL
jgi:hypothetical protein